MMPDVGSTTEHPGNDGDDVWDRLSRPEWSECAVREPLTSLMTLTPFCATVHSGDVAKPQTVTPAVGSTTEHLGDDGDEVWDRSSRSEWME